MKEIPHNVENHNKNLHGAQGVDGLTGFYHGTYYDRGFPRVAEEHKKLTDIRAELTKIGGENK